MILLAVLAFMMIFIVLGFGCRRFGGEMQIVGSNSAAISGACHVDQMPERRRREMVLRKVAWGEIPSSESDRDKRETTKSEHEVGLGLGMGGGSKNRGTRNAAYNADDLSDMLDRDGDVEQSGYQALRGQVELIDSRGLAKSTAVAHCGFSDGFVFKPEEGKLYA